MKLRPLKDAIYFAFNEDATEGRINSKSSSGILIATDMKYQDQKEARWGIVLAKGPEVPDDIVVGEYILVEPLQWTTMMNYDDVRFWKTDYTKIMATSAEEFYRY